VIVIIGLLDCNYFSSSSTWSYFLQLLLSFVCIRITMQAKRLNNNKLTWQEEYQENSLNWETSRLCVWVSDSLTLLYLHQFHLVNDNFLVLCRLQSPPVKQWSLSVVPSPHTAPSPTSLNKGKNIWHLTLIHFIQ
jgi:hypothetical protein